MFTGALTSATAFVFGTAVLIFKLTGRIRVPGYSALAVLTAFFGGAITLGLGVIGQYVWLSLQNSRQRPHYVVRTLTIHHQR
jgi:dolichol-phosphate mannosyltransferase